MKTIKYAFILLVLVALLFTGCTGSGNVQAQETASSITEALPAASTGEVQSAKVTRIIDGDTIDVWISGNSYRVRYIGIDTPETDEFGYAEATEANRKLVQGETVTLEKDVSETDRYGRLLRYVWVDGYMVNALLVGDGYARAGEYPPDTEYAGYFKKLASYAMMHDRGLWSYSGFQGFDR